MVVGEGWSNSGEGWGSSGEGWGSSGEGWGSSGEGWGNSELTSLHIIYSFKDGQILDLSTDYLWIKVACNLG